MLQYILQIARHFMQGVMKMKAAISKSFVRGFSRISLSGRKQWPDISNGLHKDYLAIKDDWDYVGRTIRKETGNYKK